MNQEAEAQAKVNPVPVPQPEAKGSEGEVLLVDDEKNLNQEAHRLLAPFGFVKRNKREVWEAFKANPEGVERCALLAKAKAQRDGHSAAGLLLTMIRAGEHLLEAKPDTPMPTGWRWVRGADGASGTYVEDPEGTDRLPPGYDFTPSPKYGPAPRTDGWEPRTLSEEIKAQVERLAR